MSINVKPQNEQELFDTLGQIRGHLEASEKRGEQFAAAAADIETAKGAVKIAEDAVRAAKNAEDIAKALHEADRRVPENVAKQLRNLPRVHNVATDEDFRGKAEGNAFNLLLLTRSELETYLDGEALAWAKRFRKLNDMVMSAHTIMRAQSDARSQSYERAGGVKSLPFWSAFERTATEGMRALDVQTAGGVSEWIPTFYSAELFEDVRDQLELAGAFRFLPMPQSPWTLPTLLGHMRFKLIPEATSDTAGSNTAFVASDPTSGNATLTAKKLAALSYWSREADQDSIISVLPMYQNDLTYAAAYEIDNVVWNGQSTSTIDTGDDPATTDARDGFDGIRWAAKQTTKQVDFGGSVTVESLAAMVGKAGKYAQLQYGFFGTGYSGLARLLVLKDSSGNVLNLTRDRAGADATLFGGTVGVLLGYPLRVGGVVPQNLDATGIIGTANTKTAIHFVNSNMYLGGTRQAMQTEVSDHVRFEYDQRAIRATMRVAFKSKATPSASRPFVVEGVNIPSY